jgi:hypothetical protein
MQLKYTAGLHMFELIPFMGNELVCKLITYRWNGDEWTFKSLEAVYFKDSETKEKYVKILLRKYNHEI